MAFFRKALLASTMAATGLASTAGLALADEGHDDGGDKSIVNAQGADALNQLSACDNSVPILDVLPIHDADANADLPILNKTGDGNDQGKVPNGKNACTPESKDGAIDSSGSDTDDAQQGVTSTGTED